MIREDFYPPIMMSRASSIVPLEASVALLYSLVQKENSLEGARIAQVAG